MAVSIFTTPPNADRCYVRSETILALAPPFQWGPGVSARELHLASGQRLIVEDTDANIRTSVGAMGTPDDATQAVDDARDVRVALEAVADQALVTEIALK